MALPNRLKANVPASAPGEHDAVSIDVAIKPEVVSFLKYTKVLEGIRVADERLLLVDKIRCFTGRPEGSDGKIQNDIKDIQFCVSRMEDEKQILPPMLKEQLSHDIWLKFWPRLKDRTELDNYLRLVEALKIIVE